MLRAAPFVLGLVASAAVLAAPRVAGACGGVVSREEPLPGQPPETITVAAQRMAFAISTTQTVLWSQIEYDGNPSDFAWVLPVGDGAYLEESTDAWFEALDTFTARHIRPPRVVCMSDDDVAGGSGSGCGCGSAQDGGGDLGAEGGDPNQSPESTVTLLHRGSVGPYETVTLDPSTGQAAQQWLADNGYAVPPEVATVLDQYAAEGLNFIALRLQPGAEVRQMTPVRVIAPGASPIVPMRMMVAGAGEKVPVTLFVIGAGRYMPVNFPSVVLSGRLLWDFAVERSNYTDLRADTLARQGGRGFLTSFAMQRPFTTPVARPDGGATGITVGTLDGPLSVTTLVDLYFAQAATNAGLMGLNCMDMESEIDGYQDLPVVETCADGSAGPGPCPDGMAVAASTFECDGFTDLALAMTGLYAMDAWVTRLEAELPALALTEDLELQASTSQAEVSSWLTAIDAENVPCPGFYIENGTQAFGARIGAPRESAALAVMGIGALGSIARRRRRQGKSR
jgi:hypothetical protein